MKKLIILSCLLMFITAIDSFALGQASKFTDEELIQRMYSPSVPVAERAIRELGMRGYKPAIPDLMKFMYVENRQLRTAAIWSLGVLDATEATDDLYDIVWDDSKKVTVWDRIAAAQALGNMPQTRVSDIIDILEYHPDEKVKYAAAKALSKRPEPEAKKAVEPYKDLLGVK